MITPGNAQDTAVEPVRVLLCIIAVVGKRLDVHIAFWGLFISIDSLDYI